MKKYRETKQAKKFSRTEYLESEKTKKYMKKHVPPAKMSKWIREATHAKKENEQLGKLVDDSTTVVHVKNIKKSNGFPSLKKK
jgi:uncharacterized membrane-anchored protein YjiN (DUF445 family)